MLIVLFNAGKSNSTISAICNFSRVFRRSLLGTLHWSAFPKVTLYQGLAMSHKRCVFLYKVAEFDQNAQICEKGETTKKQRQKQGYVRSYVRTYGYEPQGIGYEPQGFGYEPQGFSYEPQGFGYEPQGFGYV